MSAPETQLDALRAEIDRIDAALHDLLMERSAVVAHLTEAKGTAPSLQPAREMQVLRALVQRHQGPMPVTSVVRIWREIMSASLAQQMDLQIFTYGGEEIGSFRSLIRFHFGAAHVSELKAAGHVVREVGERDKALGVLPVPTFEGPQPWWPALVLGGEDAPRIVARLPMISGADEYAFPDALGIARQMQVPTGDDVTLIGVQAQEDLGRAHVLQRLASEGIKAQLASITTADSGDRFMLIETAEYLREDDPRLTAIAASEPTIGRMKVVGGYARPVPVSS